MISSIILVGATGMLGKALLPELKRLGKVIPVSSKEMDLKNPAAIWSLIRREKAEIVVNAAAYTDVDGCEFNPDLAMAINGRGPGTIAAACREIGSRMVHFSTDYVFDGTARRPYRESDTPCPINRYGRSKLAGENAVAKEGVQHLIIRTAWLYGPGGGNFPGKIHQMAREKNEIRVVDDQIGSPTYTIHLAKAVRESISRGATGVYHLVNAGKASWYQVAQRVAAKADPSCRVIPVKTSEFPRPARRPAWTVLSTQKADRRLGIRLPPWEEGLDNFLAALGDSD